VNDLGKEIKYCIEFYKNWKVVTKNWAYLLPVFNQEDIYRVMPEMCKKFHKVSFQYTTLMSDGKKDI
jgi:hypothetical protein